MYIIWLVLAGVFFLAEIATLSFFIVWLGIAALLAMGVSFITDSILIQIIVFTITSIILVFATKPLVKKFLDKKTIPTNKDNLLGKKGVVVKDIDPVHGVGQVKLQNEVWSAKSENDQKIAEGTEIEVQQIEGVKLVVKPLKEKINV